MLLQWGGILCVITMGGGERLCVIKMGGVFFYTGRGVGCYYTVSGRGCVLLHGEGRERVCVITL